MSIKPLRTFINNNAWSVLCAIGALLVGYVYAQTDKRYPLRSEFEAQVNAVASHDKRLTEIETTAKVAANGSVEVNRKLDKTQGDVENINRQLNRLVGAFEAKGMIPAQPSP